MSYYTWHVQAVRAAQLQEEQQAVRAAGWGRCGRSRVEGHAHVVDLETRRRRASAKVLPGRGRIKLRAYHGALWQQQQGGNVPHWHLPAPAAAPACHRSGCAQPIFVLLKQSLHRMARVSGKAAATCSRRARRYAARAPVRTVLPCPGRHSSPPSRRAASQSGSNSTEPSAAKGPESSGPGFAESECVQ